MLRKKAVLGYMLLSALVGGGISYVGFNYLNKGAAEAAPQAAAPSEGCEYSISRLGGYQYTHPLYLAEPRCESPSFIGLKSEISDFIENMKTTNELDYASVYVKNLNTNEWMDVNPSSTYHPGSLFKVLTMITLLRMAETNVGIMDKLVSYDKENNPPTQTFNSKVIQPGRAYKIKDLIYYMVVYSDNHATMLLHDYMDVDLFQKVFTDLGLQKPNVYDNKYTLSVKEYSRFISVLYDGGYLTLPASEFAVSMLCESDFNMGITKNIPPTVKVAHKFGEAGKPGDRELHESAIVYLNNKPYLVTIMTKGRESVKLADVMARISKMVYDYMAAQAV